MKKHPLSAVISHLSCNGKISIYATPVIDAKGNPSYPTADVLLNVAILVKRDQQYYRNLYTVDNTRKIADIYIESATVASQKVTSIDLDKLQDNLTTVDGLTKMTIVDRTQSNLIPIRKAFGLKLTVILDGHMPY